MSFSYFEDLNKRYQEVVRTSNSKLVQLLKLSEEQGLPHDTAPMRFLKRARLLATFLIDDQGIFHKKKLKELQSLLENEGNLFYPYGLNDPFFLEHIQRQVKVFLENEGVFKKLRTLQPPVCNPLAHAIVCHSLGITGKHILTAADIKRAILSACLVPLRQNVGSCFATAPAILVQKDFLETLLDDLYEILFTGKLRRVFGGEESVVPLAPSLGSSFFQEQISPRHKEALEYACKAIGVTDKDIPLLLSKALGKKVGRFLHEVILTLSGLTQQEYEDIRIQPTGFLRGDQGKGAQVLTFQMLEKKAKMAFCSVFDHALLKAWEFTVASFSEVKMEFSAWNLYVSLGLHPEEKEGIGQVILQFLEEKLAVLQKKAENLHGQYESAIGRARAVESIMRDTFDDRERRRLGAELQGNLHHARSLQDMRDEAYSAGSHYVTLLKRLIKQYEVFFPLYFQEIYDPDMIKGTQDFYGDSPAGFRLVYKHGRSDPSLWTLIYDQEVYISALVDFFTMTEPQILSSLEWEGGEDPFAELNTAVITHVRSQAFIETALKRIQTVYRSPTREERTPWCYISGGTLSTLAKTYFRKEGKPQEESRGVESPADLAIFLIETLKNLPLKQEGKEFLLSSPGHVFILCPQFSPFREGWHDSGFTYTWVRDQIFFPGQKFYATIELSRAEQDFLFTKWSAFFPHLSLTTFAKMSVIDFRNAVLNLLPSHFSQEHFGGLLDSFLYESLPLIPIKDAGAWIERLLSPFEVDLAVVLSHFPKITEEYLTSSEIKEMAKTLYVLAVNTIALSFDLQKEVEKRARLIGLSAPAPLLFADTNWTTYFFGCVVNPGSGNLELWRMNYLGTEGFPMNSWKSYFGPGDTLPWTVYPDLI